MSRVLDACAVLAYLNDERGSNKVEQLIDSGHTIISIVNVVEVYEQIYILMGQDEADDTLDWMYEKMDVRCEDDRDLARTAGEIAAYLGVPLGDAFCFNSEYACPRSLIRSYE